MSLSNRENELYEFIKNNEGVTVKQIQEQLSLAHVGALGKLLKPGLIGKDKRRTGEGYSVKVTTIYVVIKEEKIA